MRIGPRFQILPSAGGYRTALLSATTVCGRKDKLGGTLVAKRLTTGKKLKRRLEELERRAGTSDGGSSSGNEKPSPPAPKPKRTQAPKSSRQTPPAPAKPVLQGQYTPPMHHDDEYLFPQSYDERERSNTPPMFAYSTYPPPPEEMMMPAYGAPVQGYRPMPTESYPDYLAPQPGVPVTLPSMTHFSDAIKREPTGYPPEEGLQHYMSYNGYLPGAVDMSAGHPSPYDHMPHVSASSSSSRNLPPPSYGRDPVRESRC